MKIVNESEFEIKCIKDLDIGEIIYITDGWAQIKLLDAELHIKYKIKKD